ncbi:MAG: DUF1592 domain-containing protein [Myxococcaceae bacterium]|nr:DUF1592 domain-containing protein [Myxococcaceae bacterium]
MPLPHLRSALVPLALAALPGCMGLATMNAPAPAAADDAPFPALPPQSAPGGGSGSSEPANRCAAGEGRLHLPARLLLLTGPQLAATSARLSPTQPPKVLTLTDDAAASTAAIDELSAQALFDEAERLAALTPLSACLQTAPADDACAASFIDDVGRRLFRRPLSSDERTTALGWFRQARTQWGTPDAARLTVQAMLQTPATLYRTELGLPSNGAATQLTAEELASAVAFALTDAPPDAPLQAAADDGTLATPSVLRAQATRLLATPAARQKLRRFFTRLLRLESLASGELQKSATAFPAFTDAVRHQAIEETLRFATRELLDEHAGLPELLTASHTWLGPDEADLARAMGLEPPTSLSRVSWPKAQRHGVVTHPSVMSALAKPDRTSLTLRGLFLWEGLLCQTVGAPPPGAAASSTGGTNRDPDATTRQNFEYFQQSAPGCQSCHSLFMPPALALERWDGAGAYRTTDHGRPIDTRATVRSTGALDGEYADGPALLDAIAGSALARDCFAAHLSQWLSTHQVPLQQAPCTASDLAGHDGARPMDQVLLEALLDPSFATREAVP